MLQLPIKKLFGGLLMAFVILVSPAFKAGSIDVTDKEEAIRTIKITGTDKMKFDVTSINAIPGETIRIVFTSESKFPKESMAHNVVVLDKGTDAAAFVNASAMARDHKYIAPEFKDKVIAATGLAGGGETVEVTFTVPEETGVYEYVCSFPGHYYGGMKGVLTVKQPLG